MLLQQILEKRTFDNRIFTIDCSQILASGQTITTISTVTDDAAELTFTGPIVNIAAVTLPTGNVVPIGQGIQVAISGGTLAGALSQLLTIRARFATSTDRAVEATVQLFLTDTPGLSPTEFC